MENNKVVKMLPFLYKIHMHKGNMNEYKRVAKFHERVKKEKPDDYGELSEFFFEKMKKLKSDLKILKTMNAVLTLELEFSRLPWYKKITLRKEYMERSRALIDIKGTTDDDN